MNYDNLRCALDSHPDAGTSPPWNGATNEQLATWVNTPSINYRPTDAPSIDMWDVIINNDEYEQLSAGERDVIKTTLFGGGRQTVDVSDNSTPVSTMLIRVFGAGTQTRTDLLAAFTYQKAPWEEYDVGQEVNASHIEEARNHTCGG